MRDAASRLRLSRARVDLPMRCLVHIGAEKTGSTSLQHFLALNERHLMSAGYGLFRSANNGGLQEPNSRPIAVMFADPVFPETFYQSHGITDADCLERFSEDVAETFRSFLASLPGEVHTVILTSEHFQSRLKRQDQVDRLRDFLAGLFDDVKIICYFREQSALCQSFYSTRLKGGETKPLSIFQKQCSPANWYYNYLDMFGLWERAFGHDALQARIYDRMEMIGQDIRKDFLARLPDPIAPDDPALDYTAPDLNESFGPLGAYAMRMLNRVLPPGDITSLGGRVRQRLIAVIERVGLFRAGRCEISNRAAIQDAFDPMNRQLAVRYLGRDDNPFRGPGA